MEGIHENAVRILSDAGFENVETHAAALSEDALIERVRNAHYLGIRSRTRVTPRILAAATELRGIGCFCIGTNQVDTDAAKSRGIPVFNAPFSPEAAETGINITGEYLQTDDKIGYVVVDFDIDEGFDTQRLERLKAIDGTLRARIVVR